MMLGKMVHVGLCLGVLATAAPAIQLTAQDFEWNRQMDEGETLVVRGISGDVRATLARGSTAEVVATKSGRSSDFDKVRIEVFEERGATVICVLYDSRRRD